MSLNITNIFFDHGGHYAEEELKWVSKNPTCAITFKTSSLEEITYAEVVDKICRKIARDGAKRLLKLSYIPMSNNLAREMYIFDDEDLFAYLTTIDKLGFRRVLHVEVMKESGINQRSEHLSRTEAESSFGFNYEEEAVPNGICDVPNDGIVTIFREEGTREKQREPHIGEPHIEEPHIEEPLIEEVESDGKEHDGNGERPEADSKEDGLNGFDEDIELSRHTEESQFGEAWEDGIGIDLKQQFPSKEALQDLVDRASHKHCFGVRTYKSDTVRLILKCSQESKGCSWYIRAAKVGGSDFFSVRRYRSKHTCSRAVQSSSNCKRRGNPRLVAAVLHQDYPGQFDTPVPKTIVDVVHRRAGVAVSYSTALRGKKLHVSDVRGTPEEGYRVLFSYLYMLELVNPGTKTNVQLDAHNRFEYLFVALGASIEGFQWMRKVIVVDATFLKTVYGGQLVFATAQDPNHHHYPIAFGIIDTENHVSWSWFLENLKAVIPDDPELVFVSDRHKSIIHGVSKVFPLARHVHCIWHLAQNVKGHAQQGVKRDDVVDKFIQCAHAYIVSEFTQEFDDFTKRYPACAKFLVDKIDLHRWARCSFEGDKYNIDTSNSCESMNSVFRKDRKLSLLPMVDKIVEKFAFWSNKYRNECASMPSTKVVVPYVENVLHDRCPIAKCLTVREVNGMEFQYDVVGADGVTYLVDLASRTCMCRMFDIDKYPCVHAIAAVMAKIKKDGRTSTLSIYDMCSRYYLVESWSRAYVRTIYTVPHVSTWSVPEDVLKLFANPPDYTAKKGRNKEKRHPSEGESRKKKKKTSNKCNRYKNLGDWFEPMSR